MDPGTIGEVRKAGYDLVIGVEGIGSGKSGEEGLGLMGESSIMIGLGLRGEERGRGSWDYWGSGWRENVWNGIYGNGAKYYLL